MGATMISLDTELTASAISKLRSVANSLSKKRGFALDSSLTSFSQAGGLDEAGRTLSPISDERAPEATQALATYLLGTANILETALNNTMRTDDSFSGALANMGSLFNNYLNSAQPQITNFMMQSRAVEPKTNEFANPAAVATSELSLNSAHTKVTSTNSALAIAASDFWNSNAKLINNAVEELNEVHHALSSSAETQWIADAMRTITQVQNAGLEYAANSQSLAQHTAMLADAADSEKIIAKAAWYSYLAAKKPEEKEAIEWAYLSDYPGRMTSNLVPAIPTFNRLLPDLKSMPGDPYSTRDIPSPAAPSFEPTSLPQPIRDALSNRGLSDLAHASTPAEVIQQMGRPNPEMMERLAAGAAPTQAASAVMAPPSPTSTMGPPTGGAPAGGMHGAGGPGVGSAFSPVSGGGFGSGAGSGAAGGASGANGLGGLGAVGTPGAGASGRHAAGSASGAGRGVGSANGIGNSANGAARGGQMGAGLGAGANGSSRGAANMGFGAGAGAGSAAGTGAGAGRPGFANTGFGSGGAGAAGSMSGTPGATGGTGTAAGSSNVYAANNAAAGQRGGMVAGHPMMGGRNQNKRGGDKAAKVKTVTSAVEREGNLKALLGDAPLLLPDIIGHNVRR